MKPKAVWLCTGLLGGVLLTLGLQHALRGHEEQPRAAPPSREPAEDIRAALERSRADVARLRAELEEARGRLEEELRRRPAPPERGGGGAPGAAETPAAPPGEEEILETVVAFGKDLGAVIEGRGEEAKKRVRDLFARGGKLAVDLLVARFEDEATDLGLRVVIAHALAQSGSPEAVAALARVLADPEVGMLELRLATHGLAFSDAEGIDDALSAVAHRAADIGARANAAFGLARRKRPEGLDLYVKATDEAMANRDPVALQYLGGFMLLGDEAFPAMRERLLTYTEPQAVISLIEILKGKGDKGAIANLEKLAADEGTSAGVRKTAEGALRALRGG